MKILKAMLPLMLVAICSCKQKVSNNDYLAKLNDPILYCKTVKKLNDVVLENNFTPVIASRNYVYANIAAYECVAAGSNEYNSLAKQIKHLPELQKPDTSKKINFNLAALLSKRLCR
jgi:hypothetical protein